MKKSLLIIFMIVDIALAALAAVLIVVHYRPKSIPGGLPVPLFPPRPNSTAVSTSSSTQISPPKTQLVAVNPAVATHTTRKILFAYHNRMANQVQIRADFTGWKAEPMQKNGGTWTYITALEPGEYAYGFAVDSRFTRDPANKRTKKIGTTLVSVVVVSPAASFRPSR